MTRRTRDPKKGTNRTKKRTLRYEKYLLKVTVLKTFDKLKRDKNSENNILSI